MRRFNNRRRFYRPNRLLSQIFAVAFVSLGLICLVGFLTNQKSLKHLRLFLGDGLYLVGPVCFLMVYFLFRNRFKAALYTLFLLPLGAILMPYFHLNGGYCYKLSKNLYSNLIPIGIILVVGVFLLSYRRRLPSLRKVVSIYYGVRRLGRVLLQWVPKAFRWLSLSGNKKKEGIGTNGCEIQEPDGSTSSFHERLPIMIPGELQERIKKYISRKNVSLNDISGYHNLTVHLKSDIDGYMQDRARAKQYIGESNIKAYLLYGPGGTGKSYFAQCFMGYLKKRYGFIPFDVKNWQQLAGSSWQQSMKALMEFLDTIRDCRSHGLKVCITWDEFDGYIGGEMASDTKRIAAVKAAFDDWHAETASPLIFFATTNDPQEFTEEMLRPGRLQPVFFPPPDIEARRAIIQRHLKNRKIEEGEREKILEWIASHTEKATISELINYMDNVGSKVYERMRHLAQDRPITLDDFQREPIKIKDYYVFLQKMKKKFNYKHGHKLGIFNEMEKLVVNG